MGARPASLLPSRRAAAALRLCVVVGALALASASAAARQPGQVVVPPPGVTQELQLRDGSVLYGRIEAVSPESVSFRTLGGAVVTVSQSDVLWVRVARGRLRGGEFLPEDSNATRLFFGPTARSLARGQVYLGVYEFLLPFVQVGITDRVSIGGGTPLFFGGGGDHPVWVTPKVQVYRGDRVQVAAGLLHFFNVDEAQFGIAYGVATAGGGDNALSVGAGWGYWRGGGDDLGDDKEATAIVMVGGERRISRRLKLITENYVFREGGIVSAGVRFMGGRLSADLGLAVPLGAEEAIAFPLVNFVWVF